MAQVCLPLKTHNIERQKSGIILSKYANSSNWTTKNYGISWINVPVITLLNNFIYFLTRALWNSYHYFHFADGETKTLKKSKI